jgi:hypothetical protein
MNNSNERRPRLSPTPMSRRLVRCAAALLLAPFAAIAADWRYVETTPDERLVPRYYRIGADYALWSVSNDGVRRSAAGTTRLLYRSASSNRLPEDDVRDLVPLADGGALLDHSGIHTNVGGYCAATRMAADGRVLWNLKLPFRDEICRGIYANTAGQSWLFSGEKLYPVDADGRVGSQVAVIGQSYATRPVAVLDDGSVVAATRLRGVSTSRLARFDAQGGERWHWVREDQKPLSLVTPVSGDIVAVAIDEIGTAPNELMRWNDSGQVRSTHLLPALTGIVDVVAASDGDVYVIPSSGAYRAKTIRRIGADGSQRWEATLDCTMSYSFDPAMTRTADDGFAVACQDAFNVSRLLRLNRSGGLSSLPVPLHAVSQLVQQGDGRLLVLGQYWSTETPPESRTLIVDGMQIGTAAVDGLRDAAPSYLVGQQILADGTSFIATAPEAVQSGTTTLTLTRLAPDGRVVWTRRTNDPAYRGGAALAVGGGLVCVALDYTVTFTGSGGGMDGLVCIDAASGATRWHGSYSNDRYYGFGALSVDEDGKVRTVRSYLSNHELQRFDRNGNIESIVRSAGTPFRAVFDTRGAATVATSTGLRQYAPDGTLRLQVSATQSPIWFQSQDRPYLLSADDGSIWVIAPPSPGSSTQRRLWAVAPDGSTRWQRDLASDVFARLMLHDGALYGFGSRRDSSGSDRTFEVVLERMNPATGSTAWIHRSRHAPFAAFDGVPALSPDGREALLAYSEFDRLHFERVRTADGSLAHHAFVACGRLCGAPVATNLDSTGTARVALLAHDRDKGQTGVVIATDLSAVTTRLDQPGIAGAWWSPYANGEGITFDWLPASRTLFGGWFTYSTAGGNEPSELRWYTLQANGIADGTRRIELPILETTGGNFDAGPSVSPRRVGTAQLEFYDCTRGTVHYAFDAPVNEGRSGTITLSRLSPATQPCVLADGSTAPVAGAPPANGLDAKLSGTWFDEATAGQGLQFTVQPNGVFFAPWFTFDPSDAGNDAGRQHWFTLQGNLAEARAGVAELVLVQTIGGTFDLVPTYNANAIGTATLRVQNCDRAELDYRFADESGAGAFRARNGTLRLTRAGGCAAF